jgi:tetratricopeptide (TPR) repeat protein
MAPGEAREAELAGAIGLAGVARRPFVGRALELGELRAALERAPAGRGSLFLITGEPGIGKTRLMEESRSLAANKGWKACVGRCWEGSGAPPYWPWSQVIRAAGGDIGRLAGTPGEETAEATRGLPQLTAADPETIRFRLFDAVGRFLADLGRQAPLLVMLDDMHAADEPSLLLLRFLAQALADEPVVMLASYREREGRVKDSPQLFGELLRVGTRLSLPGLSLGEIGVFIEGATGRPASSSVVSRVHEITAGNPFFVAEVTRLLAVEGRLEEAEEPVGDPMRRIPDEVRALIRRRVAGLSREAVSSVKVAAVIGREFDLAVLALTSSLSPQRVVEVLGEAARAGVVVPDRELPGRYVFSHDLLRDTLYDDIPPARRMELHRTVARVLGETYRDDLLPHLASLAHHFVHSAPLGLASEAVTYSLRAGDRARTVLAYEDAAGHYRRALELLPVTDRASGQQRCELLLRLGDAQWRAGDIEGGHRSVEECARVAGRLGLPQVLARAALGLVGGAVPYRLGRGGILMTTPEDLAAGLRWLEQALAALPEDESPLRVQVLARLATELYATDQVERRMAFSRQAVEMARRVDDTEALLVALHGRHWANMVPDGVDARLANAEEMLRVATGVGTQEMAFLARHARLHCFLELADIGGVDRELEAMARVAGRIREPFYLWHTASLRTMRTIVDGRLEEAEAMAADAARFEGLRRTQYLNYDFENVNLLAIRWAQGRLEEVREVNAHYSRRFPLVARWRDALVAAELGEVAAARAEVERHARRDFAELPRDGLWLLHLCSLAEACAVIADRARAALLYELLSPYAGRNAVSVSTMSFGPVALRLGMLSGLLGRWEAAERHLSLAASSCARQGARPISARVLYEHARVLAARAGDGDLTRAARLLAQAERICRELQLPGVLDRVVRLAASVGRSEQAMVPAVSAAVFRREGQYWTVAYGRQVARLRDTKGLRYIASLLGVPGREVHVLELVGAGDNGGPPAGGAPSWSAAQEGGLRASRLDDSVPVLDPQAKRAYRSRLEELAEDLEQARAWNDLERAARVEQEIEALTEELTRAAGLGGRDRGLPSPAERARVSATKAIKAAIRTITLECPALGAHLSASIRTGRFCCYAPPGQAPPSWRL